MAKDKFDESPVMQALTPKAKPVETEPLAVKPNGFKVTSAGKGSSFVAADTIEDAIRGYNDQHGTNYARKQLQIEA